MEKLNITQRQKKFAEAYSKSGNGTEAYKSAYPNVKETTARINASKLLANTNIKQYLEELNHESKTNKIAEIQEIKELWTTTMRNEEEKTRDRLKASELLAKTAGAFIENVNLKVTEPVQIIDDIGRAEGEDG